MMTREEAKEEILDYMKSDCYLDAPSNEACEIAVKALRPVSRERVEKVWRGEWTTDGVCRKCGFDAMYYDGLPAQVHTNFCPHCGAPMTDEAVQIVMKRLEALKDV